MSNDFTGIVVKKAQVLRDKKGIKMITINGRHYAQVILNSKTNYGGLLDMNGNPVFLLPKDSMASFLVPYRSVQNHIYNEGLAYLSLPENYKVRISIDLGKTGNTLENGKNEHNWVRIDNVTVTQLKGLIEQRKFVSFTISQKQKGKDYVTKDGTKRTTILLPASTKYEGCRISCSPKLISQIDNHPNILRVVLPPSAVFAVQKTELLGLNPQTQKAVYGPTQIVAKITGSEISELFEFSKQMALQQRKTSQKEEDVELEGEIG